MKNLKKLRWGHFSQNFFTVRWRYFSTNKGSIPSVTDLVETLVIGRASSKINNREKIFVGDSLFCSTGGVQFNGKNRIFGHSAL